MWVNYENGHTVICSGFTRAENIVMYFLCLNNVLPVDNDIKDIIMVI